MAGIRVLIVDDVAQVRQDLRTILTLIGNIEVIGEAGNGLEAVHQVEILRPEVILMDLEMPVLDGYDAIRRIKKCFPSCRLVALTLYGYEAAREKAFRAGADAFIVKGSPVDELVQAINASQRFISDGGSPCP